MERSFSLDDMIGGIYRLGQAGMGRTDSEAAFQEVGYSYDRPALATQVAALSY